MRLLISKECQFYTFVVLKNNHPLHKTVKNPRGISAYNREEALTEAKQPQLAGRLPAGPGYARPGAWIN